LNRASPPEPFAACALPNQASARHLIRPARADCADCKTEVVFEAGNVPLPKLCVRCALIRRGVPLIYLSEKPNQS